MDEAMSEEAMGLTVMYKISMKLKVFYRKNDFRQRH